MPATDERTTALCREITARLRAVALDEGEDLTLAERRALIEVALEIERRVRDEAGRRG